MAGPGLDALVLGVGSYSHVAKGPIFKDGFTNLTQAQLADASRAVFSFCDWLIDRRASFPVPLSSVELLLSAPGEGPTLFDRVNIERCTSENVERAVWAWRKRAERHQEGMTLLYCCGLGAAVAPGNYILLLENFGASVDLEGAALDLDGLYLGMMPSRARIDISRRQLYFYNLTSPEPSRGERPWGWGGPGLRELTNFRRPLAPILDGTPDDRKSSILTTFAPARSFTSTSAGIGTSSDLLLEALDGGAATRANKEWVVTVESVASLLGSRDLNVARSIRSVGFEQAGIIRRVSGPPPGKALVFDRRRIMQDRPGLHALIIGVSSYPYLLSDRRDLAETLVLPAITSPTVSAIDIYNWLLAHQDDLSVPLASIRLLLSPSKQERPLVELQRERGDFATLEKTLQAAAHWREDCSSHPDNMAFFYFAGHGARRETDDTVLLLENFADGFGGLLRNAVDVKTLTAGMKPGPSRNNMARRQLYFIDACRVDPDEFKKFEYLDTTQIFTVEAGGIDDRIVSKFHAALPGTKAFARPLHASFFADALVQSLSKAVVDHDGKRAVTAQSLSEELQRQIDQINANVLGPYKLRQDYSLEGQQLQNLNKLVIWSSRDRP